jgi:hypothetical protein
MTMQRERLSDRRLAEVFDFKQSPAQKWAWTATIGRFADGRIGEIFLDAPKETPQAELAQESAIVASIALQHGVPLDVIRHALAGRGQGPLALALELATEPQPPAASAAAAQGGAV